MVLKLSLLMHLSGIMLLCTTMAHFASAFKDAPSIANTEFAPPLLEVKSQLSRTQIVEPMSVLPATHKSPDPLPIAVLEPTLGITGEQVPLDMAGHASAKSLLQCPFALARSSLKALSVLKHSPLSVAFIRKQLHKISFRLLKA